MTRKELAKQINLFHKGNETPSIKDIEQELKAIKKSWPGTRWVEPDEIVVPIKEVVLKDAGGEFDFGTYFIHMSANNLDYPYITIKNKKKIISDYPHPHVNIDTLCMGDGEVLFNSAIHEGRLEDAITIIETILRTYGGSPYIRLSYWYNPIKCISCQNIILDDDFICEKCKKSMCEDCVRSTSTYDICCLKCFRG